MHGSEALIFAYGSNDDDLVLFYLGLIFLNHKLFCSVGLSSDTSQCRHFFTRDSVCRNFGNEIFWLFSHQWLPAGAKFWLWYRQQLLERNWNEFYLAMAFVHLTRQGPGRKTFVSPTISGEEKLQLLSRQWLPNKDLLTFFLHKDQNISPAPTACYQLFYSYLNLSAIISRKI